MQHLKPEPLFPYLSALHKVEGLFPTLEIARLPLALPWLRVISYILVQPVVADNIVVQQAGPGVGIRLGKGFPS